MLIDIHFFHTGAQEEPGGEYFCQQAILLDVITVFVLLYYISNVIIRRRGLAACKPVSFRSVHDFFCPNQYLWDLCCLWANALSLTPLVSSYQVLPLTGYEMVLPHNPHLVPTTRHLVGAPSYTLLQWNWLMVWKGWDDG